MFTRMVVDKPSWDRSPGLSGGIDYQACKRLTGCWAGPLGAVLFAASPIVQRSSAAVIHEHLVTLGMLLAAMALPSELSPQRRYWPL
jgi:hypothetical protein